MPTRILADEGHDISVFYANSNIAPRSEYDKRLVELERYAAMQGLEVVEGVYDPETWEREVASIGESIKSFSPALGEAFAAKHVGAHDAHDAPSYDGVGSVSALLDDARRKERCRACYRLRLEEAASFAAGPPCVVLA